MKTKMLLDYLTQIAQDFNRAVKKQSWADTHAYYQKMKGAMTTAKILGYKIDIWTESIKPTYMCYIRIEDENENIIGQSPNETKWYNCYKWKIFLDTRKPL